MARLAGEERLAIARGDTVLLWEPFADSGRAGPITVPLDFPVTAVSWNQNNKVICAAGINAKESNAVLFHRDGQAMGGLPVNGTVCGISFSRASKFLALASTSCIEVWNLRSPVRSALLSLF